jgi:hypothetical protein
MTESNGFSENDLQQHFHAWQRCLNMYIKSGVKNNAGDHRN